MILLGYGSLIEAPVLLNMNFSYDDLHSLLVKALPKVSNPEDHANSAMALDCIATVSEDFLPE